jgi:hypothetical protein
MDKSNKPKPKPKEKKKEYQIYPPPQFIGNLPLNFQLQVNHFIFKLKETTTTFQWSSEFSTTTLQFVFLLLIL